MAFRMAGTMYQISFQSLSKSIFRIFQIKSVSTESILDFSPCLLSKNIYIILRVEPKDSGQKSTLYKVFLA